VLFKGIWKFRQVRILANGVLDIVSGGKLKLAGVEVSKTATGNGTGELKVTVLAI